MTSSSLCLMVPQRFASDVAALLKMQRIDYVVLNAGILKYPNVSRTTPQSDQI